MRKWKIPPNIVDPVACHHAPERAEQFLLEAALVHVADIVCRALEFGAGGTWLVPPLKEASWERLGIPVNTLAAILKQSEPQLAETFAILAEGT